MIATDALSRVLTASFIPLFTIEYIGNQPPNYVLKVELLTLCFKGLGTILLSGA